METVVEIAEKTLEENEIYAGADTVADTGQEAAWRQLCTSIRIWACCMYTHTSLAMGIISIICRGRILYGFYSMEDIYGEYYMEEYHTEI